MKQLILLTTISISVNVQVVNKLNNFYKIYAMFNLILYIINNQQLNLNQCKCCDQH